MKKTRRIRLRKKPVHDSHVQILTRNVRLYRVLPERLKRDLHGHVNVFLSEKKYIGCAGLEVTDEIRVTVAGQACLLLLNREVTYFPGFSTILVYPDAYKTTEVIYDGDIELHEEAVRAGESWHRGPVVLSWKDVLRSASGVSDGYNVVLHEFAHKLDEENDDADGLPILQDRAYYEHWAQILSTEYRSLEGRIARGENCVLDEYGLTSPPEFFAVSTESFFEKPVLMKDRLPDLYEQLQRFYRLDPASWKEAG